uniref:Protein E6 n=1 Tax=Mops bat papillomavirus TaxID=3141892 RepID=A0AAU7E1W9_9PAPI
MAVTGVIKCQFSGTFALMACADSDADRSEALDNRPSSIRGLCDQANICLEELLIFCQCCWRHLSHYDKALFELCELTLNWNHAVPYALCQGCLRLKNQVEFLCFYEGTLTSTDVEREFNTSIYAQEIKCLKCSRRLTYIEIQACVFGLEAFQKVKGGLRATCSMCRVF